MRAFLKSGACVAAIALALVPGAAHAQSDDPQPTAAAEPAESSGYGDIIVTAQRRSQALQDVPASITAVGATEIEDARIEGALDLGKISPGVNVSSYFGAIQITIRGLGLTSPNPNGDPSVLTYVDGVLITRPTGVGAAFEDLERIEILRGPQGTLYGRNATGGVVNLITRTPGDEFAANVSATYGSYNRIKLTGGVETPIVEGTAVRIAGYYETRDGDMLNVVTGKKVRDFDGHGIRGTLVSEIAPGFTATVRADYYKDEANGINFDQLYDSPDANAFGSRATNPSGIFPAGTAGPPTGPLYNDGYRVRFTTNPTQTHKNYGGSLTLDWEISDQFSLKSISAYRNNLFTRGDQDYDGTDADIIKEAFAIERSKAYTQELVASGNSSDGRFDYVFGAYYLNEQTDLDYLYNVPSLATLINVAQGLPPGTVPDTYAFDQTGKIMSFSMFAQGNYQLTDKLKVTAGIRQNWDQKNQFQNIVIFGADSCGGTARAGGKWDSMTWKLGADYQINDTSMVYATVSKGFKAGGVNLSACFATYEPENIMAYEIGSKNTFLDGALLLNLSAFYYDYTDLQVSVYTTTTVVTENAASAKIYGAEVEAKLQPIDNLTLSGNLSFLHTEFQDYFSVNPLEQALGGPPDDLSGRNFANAPKFLAQGAIEYFIPVGDNEIKLRYDVRHNSGYVGDVFQNPGARQDAFTLMSARAAYQFGNFEVGGFVDNLTDVTYAENRFTFGTSANVIAIWAQPRTWGLFANAKF